MNILLRLKHWQLFIIFILSLIFRNFGPLYSIVFLFWLLAINLHCIQKLNGNLKALCTALLFILSISILFLILLMAATIYQLYIFSSNKPIDAESLIFNFSFALMSQDFFITLYVLPVLLILASVFTSKIFKSVMLNSNARFSNYAAEFFFLLFSPGGVWIIQPQLNRLVNDSLDPSIQT